MNNRETNENMHTDSTRAKFVNKIPFFYEKISKGKTYNKIKTKLK